MTTAPTTDAIRVLGVSKTFRLPHETRSTLREHVMHPLRRTTYELQEALDGVTFSVGQGEFFGIIGRNGSGKSTLLRLLAGIHPPDRGTIRVTGRLSPFIELGVGFNPELSARDNIRINGTLLGLSPRDLKARFDDVVAFAELERFVDQKLKNYSSGMQLRLAYSIAIQVPFDILLLDEVLAVGDQSFQEKCFGTFDVMRASGKTVLLVTHDLGSVRRFCDRALLLRDGRIQTVGPPEDVVERYLAMEQQVARRVNSAIAAAETDGGGGGNGRSEEAEAALVGHAEAVTEPVSLLTDPAEQPPELVRAEFERVIRDQQRRLDHRAARLEEMAQLKAELAEAAREVTQLKLMAEILERRHYEEMPLPPESLRWGMRRSDVNFLAQGLASAEHVLEALGTAPETPVLEWGCGSGRTYRWLRFYPAWREQYRGCDTDETAVGWLAEHSDADVAVCGAAPPLPYANRSLGAVFGSLANVHPESYRGWLSEFARIVRPGGRVYLVTHGPEVARRSGATTLSALQEHGWAYAGTPGAPGAGFATADFMAGAAAGLFALERYEEQGHKTFDAYLLRRLPVQE